MLHNVGYAYTIGISRNKRFEELDILAETVTSSTNTSQQTNLFEPSEIGGGSIEFRNSGFLQ